MLFLATIVVLLSSIQASSVPNLNGRIVGGEPTTIETYPYHVALMLLFRKSYIYYCGGSILTKSHIVTAAHCTNNNTANKWKIRAGSTYYNTGGQVVLVRKILQHPSFNKNTMNNDISLMYTSQQLTLGLNVAPISLPGQAQAVADNTISVATGWGALSEGGSSPTQLHMVNIPIVNQAVCVAAYAGFKAITSNMICAGQVGVGGKDSCQGDSGGPLAANGVLIGITSWGRGCARPNYPGVYTKVSSFRNWIDESTRA